MNNEIQIGAVSIIRYSAQFQGLNFVYFSVAIMLDFLITNK